MADQKATVGTAQRKRNDLGSVKAQVERPATLAEAGIDKNLPHTARILASVS